MTHGEISVACYDDQAESVCAAVKAAMITTMGVSITSEPEFVSRHALE